jgi:predicted nucleic acid-binding protein
VIVVDASSLAKVVLLEEGWDSAPLTTDTATLSHSIIEVSSSIWRVALRGRIGEEEAFH